MIHCIGSSSLTSQYLRRNVSRQLHHSVVIPMEANQGLLIEGLKSLIILTSMLCEYGCFLGSHLSPSMASSVLQYLTVPIHQSQTRILRPSLPGNQDSFHYAPKLSFQENLHVDPSFRSTSPRFASILFCHPTFFHNHRAFWSFLSEGFLSLSSKIRSFF